MYVCLFIVTACLLDGWMDGGTDRETDHQKREDHSNDEKVEPHHGASDHVGRWPSSLIEDLCGQNAGHSS